MNNFKHLMVDIETMGTEPYSSIVSIGAVEFDLQTGKTGKSFYRNISLKSCEEIGLKLNADTVMWWMKQSDEARESLTYGPVDDIVAVLDSFTDFCSQEKYEIWGNSARFDLGLLQNAYDVIGEPIPWDHRKERDVRTLVALYPKAKKAQTWDGTDHNALSDCYKQIDYCHQTVLCINAFGITFFEESRTKEETNNMDTQKAMTETDVKDTFLALIEKNSVTSSKDVKDELRANGFWAKQEEVTNTIKNNYRSWSSEIEGTFNGTYFEYKKLDPTDTNDLQPLVASDGTQVDLLTFSSFVKAINNKD